MVMPLSVTPSTCHLKNDVYWRSIFQCCCVASINGQYQRNISVVVPPEWILNFIRIQYELFKMQRGFSTRHVSENDYYIWCRVAGLDRVARAFKVLPRKCNRHSGQTLKLWINKGYSASFRILDKYITSSLYISVFRNSDTPRNSWSKSFIAVLRFPLRHWSTGTFSFMRLPAM